MKSESPEATSYHEHDRHALRDVPWWNRLAYIQRCLPEALHRGIASLALKNDSRVLDFGCADQHLREAFVAGVEYVGADLAGNTRADVVINAEGKLPVDAGQFDAVLSTQVLEHVADPALYMQEAWRVLKPGGQLLLSTHGMMVYHPDPVDYWRWTSAGLQKLIEDNGFKVLGLEGVMGLAPTGLQFFQDAIYGSLPRIIRPPIILMLQGMIALSDRMHSPRSKRLNALVYIVHATKPAQD